ncbi:TetR/AcrR family transcriptional regulator [Endozoicomonas gorgoniicola]|uniref:TetR/AcrR family transcriptional regulator n=1 Tax=Endozoicomonas gorgoniicola TaxID=1234144 RepID=A0ABT3N1R7_9GAMM|nr:TetR/AcrR family transcriptional regulator [Endozoicomonas gorgoniicola]MCW7555573.1 TetR/AcrR family transcriptional regulator [Endozoicomonas gorgoniicola]
MTDDKALAAPKAQQPQRKPQARSLERRRAILDATRKLLETNTVSEISLYQVAEKAEIPPSSVYHFFPKVDALLNTLVKEVFAEFDTILDQPLKVENIGHWSDIMRQIQARYIDYYQQHQYARDLILGQHIVSAIHHADYLHDEQLGCRIRHFHEQFYQLPPLPEEYNIFAIALQIADKVYSISHQEFGNITDTMAQEGINACLAYLRQYLPENMCLQNN